MKHPAPTPSDEPVPLGPGVRADDSKDPRADKLRDFRNRGHCRRANCGICRPGRRWRLHKGPRAAAKRRVRELRYSPSFDTLEDLFSWLDA